MNRVASTLLLIPFWLPLTALGQTAPVDPSVLGALRRAAPNASWDDPLSVVADVACDGKPETVVVGRKADVVWLGVVPPAHGNRRGKVITMSWPIGHPLGKDAFCAKPVRIDVYPLSCGSELGNLPGCKPVKGCQAFAIYDEECDSFNFYWNSDKGSVGLWRN